MLSGYEDILLERDGRIITATLNRPEKRNAVSGRLHDELGRVFRDLAADPDSDVIILTGAGRAFCGGGDFDWMRDKLENPVPFSGEARHTREIVYSILECPKPTIARINGDAYGLGATIALLCDIIVAEENARIADPHVAGGMAAGDGGVLTWPFLLGMAKTKEYLLTGRPIVARDAERLGMINAAVPADELDQVVWDYARTLAAGAQDAIRYTKQALNHLVRDSAGGAFELSLAFEGLTLVSPDHQEGVRAFLERRAPRFGAAGHAG
jgi:enoyl-CoA hydratase